MIADLGFCWAKQILKSRLGVTLFEIPQGLPWTCGFGSGKSTPRIGQGGEFLSDYHSMDFLFISFYKTLQGSSSVGFDL
jgi:hypothetical protein